MSDKINTAANWRLVATKPHTLPDKGKPVLGYWEHEDVMQIVTWSGFRGAGQWEDSQGDSLEAPTHWTDLPEPPSAQLTEAK